MKSINPFTGQLIHEYPVDDPQKVAQRLEQAQSAFPNWRDTPLTDRAARLKAAARHLRDHLRTYAELITFEVGKPIAQSEGEVEKCAKVCDFYAEHAEEFLSPTRVETEAKESYVRYDPLGLILLVMPWNFPFWQAFRVLAPTLAAGNVALLKHASNVTGCSLAIERILRDAGFPPGVFASLVIPSSQVNDIIGHPAVRAVTLTGSETAGSKVAEQAGKHLKKTVLELGGSDPFIVLSDVDMEEVAKRAVGARTINSGQSCIAAKRFIVEQPIVQEFERAVVAEVEKLKVGNPMDRDTDVGPLAREDLLEELHDQVQRSISSGARLVTGGKRLPGEGFVYAPTVLADVKPGMPAFQEETFGPVMAIIPAANADEAVELANQSDYGLGASILTKDIDRAKQMAARIESGCVFINEMVKSDPRLPFGGVKRSGHGRELGIFGAREFVNIKTVWVG